MHWELSAITCVNDLYSVYRKMKDYGHFPNFINLCINNARPFLAGSGYQPYDL